MKAFQAMMTISHKSVFNILPILVRHFLKIWSSVLWLIVHLILKLNIYYLCWTHHLLYPAK